MNAGMRDDLTLALASPLARDRADEILRRWDAMETALDRISALYVVKDGYTVTQGSEKTAARIAREALRGN